jgi:hypothetical protein
MVEPQPTLVQRLIRHVLLPRERLPHIRINSNVVEQDQRGVKRITRPMVGFKAFDAAQSTLVGIALMHMIKKRPLVVDEGNEGLTTAELFYFLAASSLPQTGATTPVRSPEQHLRQNRQCS